MKWYRENNSFLRGQAKSRCMILTFKMWTKRHVLNVYFLNYTLKQFHWSLPDNVLSNRQFRAFMALETSPAFASFSMLFSSVIPAADPVRFGPHTTICFGLFLFFLFRGDYIFCYAGNLKQAKDTSKKSTLHICHRVKKWSKWLELSWACWLGMESSCSTYCVHNLLRAFISLFATFLVFHFSPTYGRARAPRTRFLRSAPPATRPTGRAGSSPARRTARAPAPPGA